MGDYSSFGRWRRMVYQQVLVKSHLFEGLSVTHLKFYGLWNGINDYRSTGKTSWLFKFNMSMSILYVFPFVLFQFLWIFFVSVKLKMATFVYMNGVSAANVLFKIILFWYRFEEQCDLFNLLTVDFLSSIPASKRAHANKIYRKNALKSNVFSVLAFAGNVLTIVTWIILPGFDTESTGKGRKKILSGWYPVPYSESPWYEIVFGYEIALISWHGCLVSLYECVLLMPLIGLYAHFVVLGYHLSTLKKNNYLKAEIQKDTDGNTLFNRELKKILYDHEKLLRYAAKFKTAYNAVITLTLALDTGALIMTILYILFGSGDALSTLKLLIYFSFALIEITLLCVSSSFVEAASAEIQHSFYSSDWYLADKEFATVGQMMMLRAMRPITLTAIKMYPVNMETLITIFRFIYSTVAVLSKMKE